MKKDTKTIKVKKFLSLVEDGATVTEAAKSVGENNSWVHRTKEELHGRFQKVLDDYGWVPPNIKRDLTRANQMKLMDMAMDAAERNPNDSKLLKVAADLTRLIGEDSQVQIYKENKGPAIDTAPQLPEALALLITDVEVDESHLKAEGGNGI